MTVLHDHPVRDSISARLRSLSATAPRRWGRMSVGQMLWHCNQVLSTSLGEIQVARRHPPIPIPVLKLMLFRLPWPRGAPTAPEYKSDLPREFEAERERCLVLIDRFISRGLDAGGWGRSVFGELSGREWSCMQARHLDHHLNQFGT